MGSNPLSGVLLNLYHVTMLKSDPLQIKIFDGFSQDEQDELKSIIENLHFPAGETILR